MTAALVPNDLWDVIEPLLPLPKPKPQGGRPRIPDRACLKGILFVLRSGMPWEMLPKELGCGSGMTWLFCVTREPFTETLGELRPMALLFVRGALTPGASVSS